MADYRATSTEFTAVADAIRTKGGTSTQLTWPNGFVSAVQAIPSGSGVVQPLSVTQNGTYNPPSGVDGYAPVTVNVSGGGGHNLPSDYQEVEFLENANTSSYFDTGIVPTQNTEVDIIYRILGNTTNGVVVGSRGGSNTSKRFFPVSLQSATPANERYVIGERSVSKDWTYANKRNNEFNNNSHNVVVINDTGANSPYTQALSYSSYVSSGHNLYLFATSDDGSPGYSYGIICDIYYCKLIDTSNNTVLAELIPCYRKSDNATGFYDLVSNIFTQCVGTFYYNNF